MGVKRILVLDLAPENGCAGQLSSILQPESELLVEFSAADSHLGDRLSRAQPHAIVLAASRACLPQVKSQLSLIRRCSPSTPVIVALEFANSRTIFELLELGAWDFIAPPCSADEVRIRIRKLVGCSAGSISLLMEEIRESLFLQQLIGDSAGFRAEVNKISFVARSDATVLITGETGAGKDLVARGIHYLSRRARHPFVPVNCGAIPGELFENELFGHEPGAFTGASAAQSGLIEEADGGTLFLDEIDSLPPATQVKLLRFLQEKEYRRLGSTKIRSSDVRIVAAMNTCPADAVRAGRLRPDLYYRLNVVTLRLPPLRERSDDIPRLAHHFLARYSSEMQKQLTGFSPHAISRLMGYAWPGNVRELEHVVERAVIFAQHSTVQPEDVVLPEPETDEAESFRTLKARTIERFERNYIIGLLAANQGNISIAAREAKKNRRAFFQLMRKYGIRGETFRVNPT
ncbi:MAG: sigma-54 dependent transcriptional regulator [Candidatus Korobacteraceae bacterium]